MFIKVITSGTHLQEGFPVAREATQFVILGFAKNTDYVDKARTDLIAPCPRGRLEGILTRFSTNLGFLSWTNKIKMKGTCLQNQAA